MGRRKARRCHPLPPRESRHRGRCGFPPSLGAWRTLLRHKQAALSAGRGAPSPGLSSSRCISPCPVGREGRWLRASRGKGGDDALYEAIDPIKITAPNATGTASRGGDGAGCQRSAALTASHS
ncbi:hypothetical protein AAFF_G00276360 [Aldrovandia affinis]|uniref:Uncharacterized protein n=1 Tax=Aldrovandia affinis TaxID=143900 RepID=A0AAD7RAL0_9TELE|nr:hypothetical protein AAFF_G00276360 [Aldrovandia affinis]